MREASKEQCVLDSRTGWRDGGNYDKQMDGWHPLRICLVLVALARSHAQTAGRTRGQGVLLPGMAHRSAVCRQQDPLSFS